MNYDFHISENVSLSRILDQLLYDQESPSVIVSFLQQHDNDFSDIIRDSCCWKLVFQLNFFCCCDEACCNYIVNKLQAIDIRTAMYLVWQAYDARAALPECIKNAFRPFMRKCRSTSLSYAAVCHPYATSAGKVVFSCI